MNVELLIGQLGDDALPLVFVNVLLQQLGLPLPVVPTLLLVGSRSTGSETLGLLIAAVAASVIADALWYLAGRRYGYRVLAGLCRLSLNPASCVSSTEARFVRWGLASLIVAKFVPGFSTVAPPIAGALRMSLGGFLFAAGIGAALWAGLALWLGYLMRDAVSVALAAFETHTTTALLGLALAFALWLSWKLLQRHLFRRRAAIGHIEATELFAALAGPTPPRVIDLRGPSLIAETGLLPGATPANLDALESLAATWSRDEAVVTLCHCPQDASAVAAARKLASAGFVLARPLRGGFDAWRANAPAHLQPRPAPRTVD